MEGIVVNIRRGRHTVYENQVIVKVDGINSREKAKELVGKRVVWKTPGKKNKVLEGIITAPHGNKGYVRVRFNKGVPGQIIGEKVQIE
ncbi:MAG TPA: 50S ribosomal protein L35ae [Nautiliaceae bacterium]|nr:50S ribosomal protein L35ae [Nautiliaceae bacterium]